MSAPLPVIPLTQQTFPPCVKVAAIAALVAMSFSILRIPLLFRAETLSADGLVQRSILLVLTSSTLTFGCLTLFRPWFRFLLAGCVAGLLIRSVYWAVEDFFEPTNTFSLSYGVSLSILLIFWSGLLVILTQPAPHHPTSNPFPATPPSDDQLTYAVPIARNQQAKIGFLLLSLVPASIGLLSVRGLVSFVTAEDSQITRQNLLQLGTDVLMFLAASYCAIAVAKSLVQHRPRLLWIAFLCALTVLIIHGIPTVSEAYNTATYQYRLRSVDLLLRSAMVLNKLSAISILLATTLSLFLLALRPPEFVRPQSNSATSS